MTKMHCPCCTSSDVTKHIEKGKWLGYWCRWCKKVVFGVKEDE